MCVCIYIYIHTERERERERDIIRWIHSGPALEVSDHRQARGAFCKLVKGREHL